jgi:hypothetical protein
MGERKISFAHPYNHRPALDDWATDAPTQLVLQPTMALPLHVRWA